MSRGEWCWFVEERYGNPAWFTGETYSLLKGASPEEIERLRKLAAQVLAEPEYVDASIITEITEQ